MRRTKYQNQFLKVELMKIKVGTQNKETIVYHY